MLTVIFFKYTCINLGSVYVVDLFHILYRLGFRGLFDFYAGNPTLSRRLKINLTVPSLLWYERKRHDFDKTAFVDINGISLYFFHPSPFWTEFPNRFPHSLQSVRPWFMLAPACHFLVTFRVIPCVKFRNNKGSISSPKILFPLKYVRCRYIQYGRIFPFRLKVQKCEIVLVELIYIWFAHCEFNISAFQLLYSFYKAKGKPWNTLSR